MSIEVEHLAFAYPGHQVLEDVSFALKPGRVGVIMGTNGSGKTTLLKTINRLMRPQKGTVRLDGRDSRAMSRRQIAAVCGYMPQKSPAISCTVFEAVLLGRRVTAAGQHSRQDLDEVETILQLMHLAPISDRLTNELSGGELQKVVIARALARRPRILLLDEPTNHLDLVNQLEVLALLRRITHELQLTTLVVTHDLNGALRFADDFIFLNQGRLHAAGGREIVTPSLVETVFKLKCTIVDVAGQRLMVPL